MKISGNTFIVTGGTGGIGGATAKMLVAEGASVGLFDVIPEEQGKTFANTVSADGKATYHRVDITNSDAVKTAVDEVVQAHGNLKGAVHCAGIAVKRPWSNDLAKSVNDFEKMIKVNTIGTFIVNAQVADAINKPLNHPDGSEEEAPFWTTSEERGVIINFASAAAKSYARCLAYGPTKKAVIGITETMADFLGPSGIRVLSISPSIVVSAMTANFSTYFTDDLLKHATFPRTPLDPSIITATIKFLIETNGPNGIDVPVDGGWKLVTSKPGVDGGPDPRELAPGCE